MYFKYIMSMVFRSEKKLEIPIKLDKDFEKEIKRKEILQEFINENNKNGTSNLLKKTFNKKHISFGSASERNFTYINNNNFSLEDLVKYHPQYLNYLNDINLNKGFFQIKNSKIKGNNSQKVFITNQKRFETFNSNNDFPGPGQYFKENKKKENKKHVLFKNYTTSFHDINFSKNIVPCIPSKNIHIKHNIEVIHNYIDKQKIFKSQKNDNDNNKPSFSDKKNQINDSYFDSNYPNSNNSTSQTINGSLTIFNQMDNKNDLDKYFYTDKNNKIFKMGQGKIYKNNAFSINILNKNSLKEKTYIKNEDDAPVRRKFISFHGFKTQTKDINFQNFGTSSVRNLFPTDKKNIIDNYKPNKKLKSNNEKIKIAKSKSLKDLNNIKLSNIKIFFKSKEDIIKENYILEKKLLNSKIGPGMYDTFQTNKQEGKNADNFGSSEVRFPISLSSESITPGPEMYFNNDFEIKKPINNHSYIPKNIIKDNLKGISKFKINIFKEEIKNEKRKSPSVGDYFPEKYNSIEYTNQKIRNKNKILKHNLNNNNNIKLQKIKLIESKKENKLDNNNNFNYPELNEQKAPFLSNDIRKEFEKMESKDINYDVGPGSYLVDSYFDWNKKSYNLLFN